MTRALLVFAALVLLVVPSSGSHDHREMVPSWETELASRDWEVVYLDDMEDGEGGWTHADLSSPPPKFHVDTYMAYGGGSSWWCGNFDYDANGGYGNSWDQRLDLPTLDLTGMTTPVLTFVYRYDSEPGYDYTYVQANQGGTWVTLNGPLGWCGKSGGDGSWQDIGAYGFPIASYGPSCDLRFRFISDGGWSDEDGIYVTDGGAFMVDNIRVYDYPSGATIFFDDVESGGACTPSGPPPSGDYWHIIDRACPASSGTHSWWCGDDADTNLVPANLYNSLTSPPVDISGLESLYLSFQVHFAIPTVDNDSVTFEITTDGGVSWHSLGTWWGDSSSCDGWSRRWRNGMNLDPYLPGSEFQLRVIMYTTDNGCGPAAYGGAGIMVDDLKLIRTFGTPTTWYVEPGGTYETIQEAIDVAVPGDIIDVGDGVYTDRVIIDKPDLTLVAGSEPVIDLGKAAPGDPYVGSCIWVSSAGTGTVIDGFIIRHGDNGVYLGASDCVIRSCEIYENYGDGTSYWGRGTGIHCEDNAIDPLRVNIIDNDIHDNSEVGLNFVRGRGHVVSGNSIRDNGRTPLSYRSIGVAIGYADSVTIVGNEVCGHRDNPFYGRGFSVLEQAGGDGHTYVGNIVHDNEYSIIFHASGEEPSTLHGNAFYGNSVGMNNITSVTMDARHNWWGDASGPNASKRGSGDPIISGDIDYTPWIGMAGGENVTCDPNPLTLTGGTPTGTISVDYAGGASAPIKGYSIKFSWDGAVATTSPASVTEGDFSTGVSSFFYPWLSGTNEITVDCSILDGAGSSIPGTLFEIEFAGQTVDYDTCTLTLFDLDFRDVSNDPVAGIYDADGEIIVDLVGPSISGVAITNPTLPHTDDFIKNTDTAVVTAIVTDTHPLFSSLDIEADLSGFGAGTINPTTYDGTTASWTVAGVTCSPTDAAITVTVSSTDPYGNTGTPDSDDIMADNTPPGAITGLDASPAHEEVVLVWGDPTGLDTNLRGVMVRYDAWGDYPFYATADPGYPATETGGDGTAYDALGVSSGATHAIVPRDIHNYTAFVYDQVLLYGPADASAQDRATNYWLGDVADDFGSWGYDGLVTVDDIDKLGGTYAVSGPGLPDAECNVGPTDDFSRVGIPLPNAGTGPVVNFEDLMIFSMNYGVVAPRIVPLLSGMSVGELALSIEEIGRTENGVELALRLSGNSGEVKGTSAVLEFDGAEFVSARLSDEMSSPAADVFFWSGEVEGRTLVDLAILGTDVTIGGSGELARITLTPTAGEYSVSFAEATLRNATNEDLTAELEGIEIIDEIPTVFRLVQNVPNPFNPITTIAYHVPYESDVSIRVYDVTGRVVRTLVDGAIEPGRHAAVWDGRSEQGENCGSGVYFCVMESAEYRGSRKMMLLK